MLETTLSDGAVEFRSEEHVLETCGVLARDVERPKGGGIFRMGPSIE